MTLKAAKWTAGLAAVTAGLMACREADMRMAGDDPILDAREAKGYPDLPPERDNASPLREEPVPRMGPGAYGAPGAPLPEAPPEIQADGVDVPPATVDSTNPVAPTPGAPPPVSPEPAQ